MAFKDFLYFFLTHLSLSLVFAFFPFPWKAPLSHFFLSDHLYPALPLQPPLAFCDWSFYPSIRSPFTHFHTQAPCTLLNPLSIAPQPSFPVVVSFYFPGLYSYHRLHSHIWRFQAKSLQYESTSNICLSKPVLPHPILPCLVPSIYLLVKLIWFFSLLLNSIPQCIYITFSLSTHWWWGM